MHRRLTTAVFFALVGLTVVLACAPLGQTAPPCQPKKSRILASNSYARVYGLNGRAYACLKASGRATKLQGATTTGDQFALAGKYVAWSSGPAHSVVNLISIQTLAKVKGFPHDTNNHVDRIVVKESGAAAWAATPSDGGDTYVQGTDRKNHDPDLLSDDTVGVVAASLRSLPGGAITWEYTDGSSGEATLF